MCALVEEAGLQGRIQVDSAGTNAFSAGGPPDPRSTQTARDRGIELESRCRQFEMEDFSRFDYVIAMDHRNYSDLLALAPDDESAEKVSLLRSFDSAAEGDEVPDPYVGARGFDRVFDICFASCRGLLDQLSEKPDLADG